MLLTSNVGTCSVKSAVIFIICSAYISALFLFMCACVSFTPSCLNRMDDIQLCKEITRLKKELHKLVSIPGRSPLGVHDCCYWTKTNKQTNKQNHDDILGNRFVHSVAKNRMSRSIPLPHIWS